MSTPPHLLLVDDHDFLRRGLRHFLERNTKATVAGEARTAEEAYAFLAHTPVDLVVLDLHLPGDNGLVAAAKIKARAPRTRILILSGQTAGTATPDQVEQALLAGADGFVSKEDGETSIAAALAALAEGLGYLSPRPATALIRQLRAAAAAPAEDSAQLTARETEVLQRLAEGASYKDIAAELGIGVKSVDTYRTRLTRKLGVSAREDLVRHALQLGLIRTGAGD